MKDIDSDIRLRDAILELKSTQSREAALLKQQFQFVFEGIKPVNLVKSVFNEIRDSRELRNNLINTSVGLFAGYLSKSLFVRASKNPVKKLVGTALMFGITNLVAKNPETIKSMGRGVLSLLRNHADHKSNRMENSKTNEIIS